MARRKQMYCAPSHGALFSSEMGVALLSGLYSIGPARYGWVIFPKPEIAAIESLKRGGGVQVLVRSCWCNSVLEGKPDGFSV